MHWLIVIGDAGALEWVIDNERMGFRKVVTSDDIAPAEPFTVYTSRGAHGNPAKDEPQVVAQGTFTSTVIGKEVTIGDETFPKSCTVSFSTVLPLRKGVPFRPLIDQLEFVGRSVRRWPSAVHRTLVPLPSGDFRVLSEAVANWPR